MRTRNLPMDLAAPFTPIDKGPERPRMAQNLQIPLPEVYPIPGSTLFAPQVSKATAVVETTDIGLSVALPAGSVGIITGFGFQITNMLTTTNVKWSILFNGSPVPGYNNLTIFPRSAPFVGNFLDLPVRIPAGVTVTVQYANLDGGTYVVGATVSGWFWPEALGKLWLQVGPS